jgi:MFS family permease
MSDPAQARRPRTRVALALPAAVTALVAAALLAGASTLPWAAVTSAGGTRRVGGLSLGGGWTLVAAIISAVFPALGLAARRPRLTAWCTLPALFAAVVSLGAGATLGSEDLRVAVLAPQVGEQVAVSTQSGVWLALAGATLLFVAGVAAALTRTDQDLDAAPPFAP